MQVSVVSQIRVGLVTLGFIWNRLRRVRNLELSRVRLSRSMLRSAHITRYLMSDSSARSCSNLSKKTSKSERGLLDLYAQTTATSRVLEIATQYSKLNSSVLTVRLRGVKSRESLTKIAVPPFCLTGRQ
uniref:Uncharacterized protein n=1 Tax=Cacopsylla melanoneura TaxID=428564 RepID=A0A8D9E5B1_9HEMI